MLHSKCPKAFTRRSSAGPGWRTPPYPRAERPTASGGPREQQRHLHSWTQSSAAKFSSTEFPLAQARPGRSDTVSVVSEQLQMFLVLLHIPQRAAGPQNQQSQERALGVWTPSLLPWTEMPTVYLVPAARAVALDDYADWEVL